MWMDARMSNVCMDDVCINVSMYGCTCVCACARVFVCT